MPQKKNFLKILIMPSSKKLIVGVFFRGEQEIMLSVLNDLLDLLKKRSNVLKLVLKYPEHAKVLRALNIILYNSNVDWGSVSKAWIKDGGDFIMLTINV